MPLNDLPAAVAEWKVRKAEADKCRAYYDGKSNQGFATPLFRQRYRWLLQQSRENLMPAAVKAFTDLKRIEGWTQADAIDDTTEMGMARLAALVHRDEFRIGNAFTLTWTAADGRPRAVFQCPGQIVPAVDDDNPDVLHHATRLWVEGRYGRANVYHADRVERYVTRQPITDATGARLRDMPDAEIGWAPFATKDAPEVIGHNFDAVPVCWWKRDADDQWSWGRSILTDAMPVQDELDYIIGVTNAAIERIARPIRYALADGTVQAPNGRVDFDPTREDVLTLIAKSAGEFSGPDGSGLVALQRHTEAKIARVLGIPPYLFDSVMGNVPSGAALRTLNERRVSTVAASNAEDSPVWRGQMELLGFNDCSPIWDDPMTLSEVEAADLATVHKDLGLPVDEWLQTAGFDPRATDSDGQTLADRVRAAMQTKAQDVASLLYAGEGAASY